METRIGLGISVHNRHKTAAEVIAYWKLNMPEGSKLVVVDDGSNVPFLGADYRFEKNVGIPVAKNKSLELLEDCEHIFLADDDIFPISKNWWKPYVESTLNHACYIFDRTPLLTTTDYKAYDLPRGCLLYFKNICLQTVGGFDVAFERYFYEHVDLSRRIFNAGLTPAMYVDVTDSTGLFYSLDQHNEIESSVTSDRGRLVEKNRAYFNEQFDSKEFKPYK